MKIVIAGGSGFIGKKLTDLLIAEGHEVVMPYKEGKPFIKGCNVMLCGLKKAQSREEIRKC